MESYYVAHRTLSSSPTCVVGSRAVYNRKLEPLLALPAANPLSSGVVATSVPTANAKECAAYLQQHWVGGRLQLRQGKACQGYTTYGKVLDAHDSELQRKTTLLMTNSAASGVSNH